MDTVNRFSSKVSHYVTYRWTYSPEIVDAVLSHAQLGQEAVIADIGAGPGTLTEMFLGKVQTLYTVEPNPEMRAKAQDLLGSLPSVRILDGYAHATALPDHQIDLITVGRAIHWFDPEPTLREFARILKPKGWIVLVRASSPDHPLQEAAKALRTSDLGWGSSPYSPELIEERLNFYLDPATVTRLEFRRSTRETFKDFLGRMTSKSGAPDPGTPLYAAFEEKALEIYNQGIPEDPVEFTIVTEVALGQLNLLNLANS